MYKVILLCSLVIFASSMSESETLLQTLQTSEFGKTIIQTIQVQLEGNSSVDKIIELLTQMKERINGEQDTERQKSRDHTQFCDDKYDEILFVIDSSEYQLAKDQQTLPLFIQEQKNKQRQLLDKQEIEDRNNLRITELTEQRDLTRSQYEARRDELTTMIGALQEGKRIISKLSTKKWDPLAGTYSFLEFSQFMFNELEAHQKSLKKQSNGIGLLYDLLLETSQDPGIQANQQGVAKIQEIIDELIESIFDLLKKELLEDNAREQDYQNQKERIVIQNRRLQATIATFKARVLIINQTILELNNDIRFNTDKSTLLRKQKDDWERTCVDYHNGYVEATKIRTQQSDILTEVIQVFNRNYNDFPSLIQNITV
ncbi:unnamed protein product (macronuclear) [Paramecium tetraurelia]|uniref:Trichocyst matrix protein n=1 Tax=Paramecium tetraurelia TaxID=5888 RepID=A0DRX5_PARTE|nr:uncharacterized protein GSPATT00019496001 [Paramecium tetraurelia]CAK85792.1 unnamed protein product [Paramecium tetraurelia]|eukprot:XP_001453189.1 hypothetical protein (macronuclear) [Paramecium tetraurelia strain d4-2]